MKVVLLPLLIWLEALIAGAQFPPGSNNNNPFLQSNSLDQGQREREREREQNPFSSNRDGNGFGNNGNRDNGNPFAPPTQQPQQPQQPPLRDPFVPFDQFPQNQFPQSQFPQSQFPQGQFPQTPGQNPYNTNPFSTRRDYGNPFLNPTRYDQTDPSYFSGIEAEKQCPQGWHLYPPNQSPTQSSCYKFVLSPVHNRVEAQRNCQAYGNGADLVSLNNMDEHSWIVRKLLASDPHHRSWYVSTRQSSPGLWTNADGSQMINMDQAFLQDQLPTYNFGEVYNYVAYNFSERRSMWGLLKVPGHDLFQYICEVPLSQVPYIQVDNRDFDYGLEVIDPLKIPRGPHFVKEPKDEVFDISRAIPLSYVTLTCVSGGWPAPTYKWYKEEYRNNTLYSILIDPLKNTKYTVSGGSLVIHEPQQKEDRGNYHCVASNEFGYVKSNKKNHCYVS